MGLILVIRSQIPEEGRLLVPSILASFTSQQRNQALTTSAVPDAESSKIAEGAWGSGVVSEETKGPR